MLGLKWLIVFPTFTLFVQEISQPWLSLSPAPVLLLFVVVSAKGMMASPVSALFAPTVSAFTMFHSENVNACMNAVCIHSARVRKL